MPFLCVQLFTGKIVVVDWIKRIIKASITQLQIFVYTFSKEKQLGLFAELSSHN